MLPFLSRGNLTLLNIAESAVADSTVIQIAESCCKELQHLNLSSCDDLTRDGLALDAVATHCASLRTLIVRNCQAGPSMIKLLAQNCHLIQHLDLSGLEFINDPLIVTIAGGLRLLETVDISWSGDVTDVGIDALMRHCFYLKELVASGLLVTSAPFLPIISNLTKWRRCQALLRVKLLERRLNTDPANQNFSSDEEFEEMCVPLRSTVYVPHLRNLRLEYCARVNDQHLSEIVAICRGTLVIVDYYAQHVKPNWLEFEKSSAFPPT